jgi:hypothetical protein
LNAVSVTDDSDHRDTDSPHILLKLDTRVVGEEDLESSVHRCPQQDTVTQAEPSLCPYRSCIVAREFRSELAWKALVNENPH